MYITAAAAAKWGVYNVQQNGGVGAYCEVRYTKWVQCNVLHFISSNMGGEQCAAKWGVGAQQEAAPGPLPILMSHQMMRMSISMRILIRGDKMIYAF